MVKRFQIIAFIACLLLIYYGARTEACCSLHPAAFTQTIGLASEAVMGGKVVHLLGYQNTAVNLAQGSQLSGNAMLLPIPAKPGTMSEKNIVDTSTFSHFLDSIASAVTPPKSDPLGESLKGAIKGADDVMVFEHDIYTIVLARDAQEIPAALSKVREDRRPALNPAIFKAYSRWYPGWTFALCCFNSRDRLTAKPMLWWYEPQDQDHLFFPALDAHDGNPPVLHTLVQVDHTVAFSADHQVLTGIDKPVPALVLDPFMTMAHQVFYSDIMRGDTKLPQPLSTTVQRLLPEYVYGQVLHQPMLQGDFVVDVKQLRTGNYKLERQLPPGAAMDFWLPIVLLSPVLVLMALASRRLIKRAANKLSPALKEG